MPTLQMASNYSEIFDPFRARNGKKHHIFAAPRFLQTDRKWRNLEDLLTVNYLGHGAYEIIFDRQDRIFFEAMWDSVSVTDTRVVELTRFGPRIDFRLIRDKNVSWRVLTMGDVTRINHCWLFNRATPQYAGLFLDKWVRLFPNALTVEDSIVTLNTKQARRDLRQTNIMGSEIADLDPDTVDPVTNGIRAFIRSQQESAQTWAQVRANANSTSTQAGIQVRSWDDSIPPDPPWNVITRSGFRFDTSAYPVVSEAYFHIVRTAYQAAETEALARSADGLTWPLANNANYGKCLTARTDHPIGYCTALAVGLEDSRKSPDIQAAGEWEGSTHMDLCLLEGHDWENDPVDDTNYQIDYINAPPINPYLEIYPGNPNRIPLLGAGIS